MVATDIFPRRTVIWVTHQSLSKHKIYVRVKIKVNKDITYGDENWIKNMVSLQLYVAKAW
jgi:hypothetical protein